MNSTISNISLDCLLSLDFSHYNILSLPNSVQQTWISLAVINGIAAPPTVLINLLVIWTVLEDENLRSSTYNLLLTSLAVMDFLIGLIVQPVFAWVLGCQIRECSYECQLNTIFGLAGIMCGFMWLANLMMSSVERYLAIEHPYFYRAKVTTKKMMIATSIVCLSLPMTVVLARVLADKAGILREIPSLLGATGCATVILFCTAKVQFTARRQRRVVDIQHVAVQQEDVVQQEEQRKRLQEYKQCFTMALLVITTVLFYCPGIVSGIIQAAKGKEVTDDFQYIAFPIFVTFIHLQSLVNPLIMSLRLSYIRKGVKKKLFFWR